MSKLALRKQYRKIRGNIPAHERALAGQKAAANFKAQPFYEQSKTFACYLPFKDEFDISYILLSLFQDQKRCYLPVLASSEENSLHFIRYHENDALSANRFSILEPINRTQQIRPEKLDIVLMPLLAFDLTGARLGTGGGFYDRTFAFLRGPIKKRPLLIGIGFDAQEAEHIPTDPWDIKPNMIITESRVLTFTDLAR